jgi:receptor protein-tyrosine kinase
MSSIEKAIEKLQKTKSSQGEQSPASSHAPENIATRQVEPLDNQAVRFAEQNTTSARQEFINFHRLHTLGMVSPDAPNTLISEEYRHIKRPIIQNAYGTASQMVDQGRLILVTSALPGEGKTFTAINLAISMSLEMDKTVLLVDADMAMCGVSNTLGFDTGKGLSDVLIDNRLPLSEVLISTNIPKLSILSAGQNHGKTAELLSSQSMQNLVADLAHRYPDRAIVFDAPPLIATSEARVLAGLMGQIVMVVEAGRTPQQAVQEAISFLDQSKPIGFVLNKSHRSMVSGYGYYGYGSKYKKNN